MHKLVHRLMAVLVRVQLHAKILLVVRQKNAIFHLVPPATKTVAAVVLRHVRALLKFSVAIQQLAQLLPLLPVALLQAMAVQVVLAVSVVASAVAVVAEEVSAVVAVLAVVAAVADNAIVSFLFFVYL